MLSYCIQSIVSVSLDQQVGCWLLELIFRANFSPYRPFHLSVADPLDRSNLHTTGVLPKESEKNDRKKVSRLKKEIESAGAPPLGTWRGRMRLRSLEASDPAEKASSAFRDLLPPRGTRCGRGPTDDRILPDQVRSNAWPAADPLDHACRGGTRCCCRS